MLITKESSVIMGEIANTACVPADDLLSFRPSSDDMRWKLHMASKRDTFVPGDAAYCLFGVFNVVMSVIPGKTQHQADDCSRKSSPVPSRGTLIV